MNRTLPVAFLWWAVLSATCGADAQRPNVILIITDDQGYGDLGCHGNTMIRTPHLDQLYRESVRFTDFHVDPTCSPTRSACSLAAILRAPVCGTRLWAARS